MSRNLSHRSNTEASRSELHPELKALSRGLKEIEELTAPNEWTPKSRSADSVEQDCIQQGLNRVFATAQNGRYSRKESEIDEGARTAVRQESAARSASDNIGRSIDNDTRMSAGMRVSFLRWDDLLRDVEGILAQWTPSVSDTSARRRERLSRYLDGATDRDAPTVEKLRSAALLPLQRCAERCWLEAGHINMRAAMQRVMATNREPFAHSTWKPTIPLVLSHEELRQYTAIDDYVPFDGADSEEAARIDSGLKVAVGRGVVSTSYDVDDEAIGEQWRRRFGDSSDGARTHASVVLDRLCADVYARACAVQHAHRRNTGRSLCIGRDVEEVAVVGIDCFTRRAVELAIGYARDDSVDEHGKSEFARSKLIPHLFGRVPRLDEEQPKRQSVAASLVAAATLLGNGSSGDVRKSCAAVVSVARWLHSDVPFRARSKGTGVIVVKPGGLDAHELVCDYLGEVYPPARWLEKLAAITSARRFAFKSRRANVTSMPEAFHNIALERPSRDPRGYALYFVDAGGTRANFASSLSHSCAGNVASTVFIRDDGSISVALHTTRHVAEGDELAYDYSACTSSEREWREAVCLCGAPACRGSYVELVCADELQQCLKRAHGPLYALALLLRASIREEGSADHAANRRAALARHGLGAAFFERDYPSETEDSTITCTPAWLERYIVSLLEEFLEFERGQLPCVLLRDAEANDAKARARVAERARLVFEQRIQALACAVSIVVMVARLRGQSHENQEQASLEGEESCASPHSRQSVLSPAPLRIMDLEVVLDAFQCVFRRLATVANRICTFSRSAAMRRKYAADPHGARCLLANLATLTNREASRLHHQCSSRSSCRAACLELRAKLIDFILEACNDSEESAAARKAGSNVGTSRSTAAHGIDGKKRRRHPAQPRAVKGKAGSGAPTKHTSLNFVEILNRVSACADALLLIAHTNTFARADFEFRQPVVSASVPVRAGELGVDLADKNESNMTLDQLRSATSPNDVVAAPGRVYGPLSDLEALLLWHDVDALAEPRLGDGKLAKSNLIGCALLPDPAAILRHLCVVESTTSGSTEPSTSTTKGPTAVVASYEQVGRQDLLGVIEDPVARARPWGGSSIRSLFFPALKADEDEDDKAAAIALKAGDGIKTSASHLPGASANANPSNKNSPEACWVDFFGSPMLDALLGDFSGIDAVIDALKPDRQQSRQTEDDSRRTSCGSSSEDSVHALAEALPDRPPSRWVACDFCSKWRIVPWTATGFDENANFSCEDQQAWGVPAVEATCDAPEPSWCEDDLVVATSTFDADAKIGVKCDALCIQTNVWFEAKIVNEKFESSSGKTREGAGAGDQMLQSDAISSLSKRKVRVHFAGWGPHFDEWFELPRELYRLAPHRAHTAANENAQRAARGLDRAQNGRKKRRRR